MKFAPAAGLVLDENVVSNRKTQPEATHKMSRSCAVNFSGVDLNQQTDTPAVPAATENACTMSNIFPMPVISPLHPADPDE